MSYGTTHCSHLPARRWGLIYAPFSYPGYRSGCGYSTYVPIADGVGVAASAAVAAAICPLG